MSRDWVDMSGENLLTQETWNAHTPAMKLVLDGHVSGEFQCCTHCLRSVIIAQVVIQSSNLVWLDGMRNSADVYKGDLGWPLITMNNLYLDHTLDMQCQRACHI